MAKEIVVLGLTDKDRRGTRYVTFGVYVPITTKKAAAGAPTPQSSLPAAMTTAWAAESTKLTALDSGDAIWAQLTQAVPSGMNQAGAVAAAQAAYPSIVAKENAAYDAKWEYVGITIDAV